VQFKLSAQQIVITILAHAVKIKVYAVYSKIFRFLNIIVIKRQIKDIATLFASEMSVGISYVVKARISTINSNRFDCAGICQKPNSIVDSSARE
jgi:hypothetical protein